ncbi:hypothetical protein GT347_27020 [Xylophilus rhododendri]|uniref:Uncharacterized protein n=1 Tax=Xylophilus rhododendri TaxID=2697032 RepID=A0A857JCC9_9BURK|nr:hypothetical protein [Xylophilus rhododendri]QHJ01318.1 hypothetical protein GT347_27020 [Xylophilus rhododendri]
MTENFYANTMAGWAKSAEACAKLATAAMFLPVFYMKDVSGLPLQAALKGDHKGSFICCWAALILSIALSHTYQITALKLISTQGIYRIPLLPRTQYWGMVISMLAGMMFFVRGII